jgi:LacI family transcriptional regulator
MANIREVAKEAGVSVATVSRVLNHPEFVSPATKEQVLSIMKELDFIPNNLARGLALNKTYTIALLIPNIMNPLYPEIAKGVEDVAHKHGYNLLLCNTEQNREKEQEYLNLLMNRRVDGCIITSSLLTADELAEAGKNRVPIAVIGRPRQIPGIHCVYTDYLQGGYTATAYLIGLGYSRIAHIRGPGYLSESEDKIKGYRKALGEKGLAFDERLVIDGDNEVESGYLAAKKLLRLDPRPEAIFASNDLAAIGALDALKTEGVKVPEEMALVGFDNIKMAAFVEPKLTTISIPVYRMGLMAARLLFDAMAERVEAKVRDTQEIDLTPKLVVRKSCGHEDRIGEIFS